MSQKTDKSIKVVELFAGVGGFRIGLEGWNNKSATSKFNRNLNSKFKIVWSNQWEPTTKIQHASDIYQNRFGNSGHTNKNIEEVETKEIPYHDLLVAGFPCQDYSVAKGLINSKGLVGKKGILWWTIYRILKEKKRKPKYLLLENVDRMLKSPSKQRGRDFAIMLKSLQELGYAVEWKVINAGEYGMPQKRRRVFIIGYYRTSKIFKEIKKREKLEWLIKDGIIANCFNSKFIPSKGKNKFELNGSLVELSNNFSLGDKKSPFLDTGLCFNGSILTFKTESNYSKKMATLGSVLQNGEVSDDFFINEEELKKWKEVKGPTLIKRKTKEGFEYNFKEGPMFFPDKLDTPSRTIVTGEGGTSPSRMKHAIKTERGFRRLTPVELERLNMFPDNHTLLNGITDVRRAFVMGNALVVGIVEKIGIELSKRF